MRAEVPNWKILCCDHLTLYLKEGNVTRCLFRCTRTRICKRLRSSIRIKTKRKRRGRKCIRTKRKSRGRKCIRWRGNKKMANKPLIVLAAWLIHFLEVGTLKSFSVLLIHIARDIDITTGRLGMYIGLYHAITIMSGIFVKKLLDRYSPRFLCMLGGLIGSLGLMLCSMVTVDIYFAIFLLISGLGFSLAILPSLISVIYAFEDQYLLPYSISCMGAGVGMMTLPVLTQKLLEAYNWRGALLILGAINLHVVVSGACLEPTALPRESNDSHCISSEIHETRETLRTQSSTKQLNGEGTSNRVEPHPLPSSVFRCCSKVVELFQAAFQRAGIGVFKQYPSLIYVLLATYLHGLSYVGWTVFVISNAEAKGFSEDIAVFLSLLGGVGNTIGRLMPGFLNFLSKDTFTSRISFILFGLIGALPLCLNKIASSFPLLCVFATINGLALGGKTIVNTTCAVDAVPLTLSPSVLSFALICTGLGETTGGWMTGRIFDITGSIDTAFLTLGCVDIFGVVVLLLSLIHEKILQLRPSSYRKMES